MAQIVDVNGNPIERRALSEQQTAQLAWLQYSYEEHPARGLNPHRLARILEDAERGHLIAQSDLFTDMEEKDPHIFAEMSKRKRVLLTLDWDVVPPRNANAAEKKLAAQVREWIDDLPGFEDVMLDGMDAIGHGFSAQEISWQRLGSLWMPKTIEHRPQRWFMNPWHNRNEIRLRGVDVDGTPLWPFGWLVHRHKAKSGYIARGGLHRVLAWPYLFKNMGVKDLAEFLHIYGLPLRLGKYPNGSTDEEKRTLLQAVASIGHNAAGIIPDEMKIEFQEAAKGTDAVHLSLINYMERSQSKAILGGTLTSQADGKSSTHALGNVHNEVRHDLMVSDARQLAATITGGLIWPMLALNVANADPRRLPQFKFETREPEDLKIFSEALPKLVGMGLPITVDWAREKLSIPAAKDGDTLLSIPNPIMALPPEFRPPAEKRPAAPGAPIAGTRMTYKTVLTNDRGEVIYPDQHALDETALPADAIAAGIDKLLAPVVAAIRAGETPDDAIEALLSAQPDMSDDQVAELLARALFVADIWGRLHGGG
ncbi:hypothetical protein KY49_3303 [Burkholderia sp. MSHR3999]|uniref:DUF935 domain-containing protein n=1 Tax=Burkholderia sp. MSHR3999 TaxID=1542965 RepID=UPI0005AC316F|nr:DUF935 domain-containing protein [Burkholderia sp. MSHR3999]KIP17977.1 hypothetical protein KY49_3303 [Burkholderia sp. MSHR3999]